MVCFLIYGCARGDESPALEQSQVPAAPAAVQDDAEHTAKKEKEIILARMNPFLTMDEESYYGRTGKEVLSELNLSVVCKSGKNSYAIIDGVVVKEKDVIMGKEVVFIDKRSVLLKDVNGEYVVNLKNE